MKDSSTPPLGSPSLATSSIREDETDRLRPSTPTQPDTLPALAATSQHNNSDTNMAELVAGLKKYIQPLDTLITNIEEDIRRLEEEEEEEEQEFEEERIKDMKALHQQVLKTYKAIDVLTEEEAAAALGLDEEYFSAMREKVEGWLNNNTRNNNNTHTHKGNNNRHSSTPSLSSVKQPKALTASPERRILPALQPQPWQQYSPLLPPFHHHSHHAQPLYPPPPFPSQFMMMPSPSPSLPPQFGYQQGPRPSPVYQHMPSPFGYSPNHQAQPHNPIYLPPLVVPTNAQAAYLNIHCKEREASSPFPLPGFREVSPSRPAGRSVEKENDKESNGNTSSDPENCTETHQQQQHDKFSYLVESATEMERCDTPSSSSSSADNSGASITIDTRRASPVVAVATSNNECEEQEDGINLLSSCLTQLAELCEERAEAEGFVSSSSSSGSVSGSSDIQPTTGDKKRKRNNNSNSNNLLPSSSSKKKSAGKSKKLKVESQEEDTSENDSRDGSTTPSDEVYTKADGKKPPRRTKTPEQLEILEREYTVSIFPSTAKRLQISKMTGLTPRGVQIWFQNKRAKEKANKRVQRLPVEDGRCSSVSMATAPVASAPSSPTPSSSSSTTTTAVSPSPVSPIGAPPSPPAPYPFAAVHLQQQQHQQHPQPPYLPVFLQPHMSPFAPSSPSSSPSSSGLKPILPPPASIMSYTQQQHPSQLYPFNIAPHPQQQQPQQHQEQQPQQQRSPVGSPLPLPVSPNREKKEIWHGALAWHDPRAQSQVSGSRSTISMVNLIAVAHEWTEPSQSSREWPGQLIVAGLGSYEQCENAFRKANFEHSLIEFQPVHESSRALYDYLIQQIGNRSTCAFVYLGGKTLLIAAEGQQLVGCLCPDNMFGSW